jgi:L,D-transpeptidase-like protein/putative peptidoglycan binding protein
VTGCALAGALAAGVVAQAPPTTGTTSTETTVTTTTSTSTTTAPATLPDGVTIAGVNVGGLTPDAAVAAVQRAFGVPLVIRVAGHRLKPTPGRLGATVYAERAVERARSVAPGTSVQVVVTIRGSRVREYVDKLAKRFDRTAVDSVLLLRQLRPLVTKGRVGRALDKNAAVRRIESALLANRRAALVLGFKPVAQNVKPTDFGAIIVIRRGSNRLFLYHAMRQVRSFGVATGQSRYPTPLGKFSIVVKWRNPWWYPPASPWAVGEKPVPPGPGNPLGTRWMGLSAPGVGIHGTPNDGSIGYSLSHGCIRMHIPDAEWLFTRVAIGTPVYIVSA